MQQRIYRSVSVACTGITCILRPVYNDQKINYFAYEKKEIEAEVGSGITRRY